MQIHIVEITLCYTVDELKINSGTLFRIFNTVSISKTLGLISLSLSSFLCFSSLITLMWCHLKRGFSFVICFIVVIATRLN